MTSRFNEKMELTYHMRHYTLEMYIDHIENIRLEMKQNRHVLPASYILDSFIGGVRAYGNSLMNALKLKSISEAVKYIKLWN